MKFLLPLLILLSASLPSPAAPAPDVRTWTPAQGGPISGTLTGVTDDTVTIKRSPDGQVFRFKISDCSPDDRTYVAQVQKDTREAESFDAKITGKIAWRLPPWNSLGWTSRQTAELWIWDEKSRMPSEMLATVDVNYENSSKRNEFFGTFSSTNAVHLWKPAKYVLKARFQASVNGGNKDLEQISAPMVLPSVSKGVVDFNMVRFSLTR